MTPAEVTRILESAGVQFALVGAMAVAARGHPRFTADFDLFTTDRRMFDASLWASVPEVDIRKGDFDDPLAGVVRIGKKPEQVDVVVGKWKWEQEVIDRAEPMNIGDITVRVPTRADLILRRSSRTSTASSAACRRMRRNSGSSCGAKPNRHPERCEGPGEWTGAQERRPGSRTPPRSLATLGMTGRRHSTLNRTTSLLPPSSTTTT